MIDVYSHYLSNFLKVTRVAVTEIEMGLFSHCISKGADSEVLKISFDNGNVGIFLK